LAAFLCASAPALCALDWSRYSDGAHGCRLDYPTSVFSAGAASADGTRLFAGPDKDTFFRVMGVDNKHSMTPAQIKAKYLRADIPGDLIYERTKGDFLVLSGRRGSNIFYIKVALSNDGQKICILEVTYPKQVKIDFDAIVTRMSRSFSAGA